MADQKLTELAAEATPTDDDIMYLVDDPGGAGIGPTSKKVVISTLFNPFPGTLTLGNESLHLLDLGADHDLIIKPGTDLGADRILTLTTGDAARTITLSGNPTLSDWFDQSVKQAASPTFADVYVTDGGNVGITGNELLTFNAAGNATFSGVGSVVVPDGAWVGADAACSWVFDSTNGDVSTLDKLGIGTATPDAPFEVSGVGYLPSYFTAYSDSSFLRPDIAFRRARDTEASPDAIQNNDYLGFLRWEPFDGNDFTSVSASIGAYADGVPAADDVPGRLELATTAAGANAPTTRVTIKSTGYVGMNIAVPLAQCHIDQSDNAAAIPVLALDQADESDGFINYIGTSAASAVGPISIWTGGASLRGYVRVEINGVQYWMQYYTAPTGP